MSIIHRGHSGQHKKGSAKKRNNHSYNHLMKKFCPVSIRENPELRPPPVVVFISTPAVMYIMAPLSALKTCPGSKVMVTIWLSFPSILD
mmetsp:Transcript_3892/g.7788  ORF Transcript_3892/g.7788 Transcript_3892/m.7788 type:complete len:89 (+) Transcript_3892:801-1067(+)